MKMEDGKRKIRTTRGKWKMENEKTPVRGRRLGRRFFHFPFSIFHLCLPFPHAPDQLAKPGLLSQPVYEPGRPIADVAREHGLDPAAVIKLASNENALGPSPLALAAARRALDDATSIPTAPPSPCAKKSPLTCKSTGPNSAWQRLQ